ncbi:uncharacterized [Tachysurus ichikawai]
MARNRESKHKERLCVAASGYRSNRSRCSDEASKRNDVMHSASGEVQGVGEIRCICNAGCSGGLHRIVCHC